MEIALWLAHGGIPAEEVASNYFGCLEIPLCAGLSALVPSTMYLMSVRKLTDRYAGVLLALALGLLGLELGQNLLGGLLDLPGRREQRLPPQPPYRRIAWHSLRP